MNLTYLICYILIILYSFSRNQNLSSEAKSKYQPPGYVFGIVWPILYFFIGLNILFLEKNLSLLLLVQSLVNISWIPVFQNKMYLSSFLLILLMIILILPIILISHDKIRFLLIFYVAWLSFAGFLNYDIYTNRKVKTITNIKTKY